MVTLRLVNRKPARFIFIARQICLDSRLGEQMPDKCGELARLFRISCQEGKRRFLHFAKGDGVHELALRFIAFLLENSGFIFPLGI